MLWAISSTIVPLLGSYQSRARERPEADFQNSGEDTSTHIMYRCRDGSINSYEGIPSSKWLYSSLLGS